MRSEGNPNLALRVQVESGGCHGFQYLMSLTGMDMIDREADTVFEEYDDGGGAMVSGSGVGGGRKSEDVSSSSSSSSSKIVMEEPSLELLKGSKIDYTVELIGSQFKIVDNPVATSSCGCGTSFDVKF